MIVKTVEGDIKIVVLDSREVAHLQKILGAVEKTLKAKREKKFTEKLLNKLK